ncbi:MAG: aldehyde dehydrogenase, partial [Pseudonocardiales bacterium]|nr:aldehyde dehydrogenase [Pseudonocardiales bacterium]
MTVDVYDDVHIGGRWVRSNSSARLDVVDPATERVYAQVPDGDAVDIDRAVVAARSVFRGWAATPTADRASILRAFADELERRNDSLSLLLTRENGSPIAETGAAGSHAAAQLRYYADMTAGVEDEIRAYPPGVSAETVVRRLPAGVAGLITPW